MEISIIMTLFTQYFSNEYKCSFLHLSFVLRNQAADVASSAVVLPSYAILALCSVVNVIVKMASWLQRISVLAEKTAFNKGIKVNIHVICKAPIVLTNSVA